jgi:hypothetical protein
MSEDLAGRLAVVTGGASGRSRRRRGPFGSLRRTRLGR